MATVVSYQDEPCGRTGVPRKNNGQFVLMPSFSTLTKPLYYVAVIALIIGFLSVGQTFAQVPPVPSQDPTRMENIHVQQGRDRIRIEQQIQQATAPLPTVRVTSPQLQPPDIDGQSLPLLTDLSHIFLAVF